MKDKKFNKTVGMILTFVIALILVGIAVALAITMSQKKVSKRETNNIIKHQGEDEAKAAETIYNVNSKLYNNDNMALTVDNQSPKVINKIKDFNTPVSVSKDRDKDVLVADEAKAKKEFGFEEDQLKGKLNKRPKNATEVQNDLNVGDYVEYEVPYTDVRTGYKFNSKNAWRVLDPGKKFSDGKYYGLKLISTGTPLMFNYNASNSNLLITPPAKALMENVFETSLNVKGLSLKDTLLRYQLNNIVCTILNDYLHTLTWEKSLVPTFNTEKDIRVYEGDESKQFSFTYYNNLIYTDIAGNKGEIPYLRLVPKNRRNEVEKITTLTLQDVDRARAMKVPNSDEEITIEEYRKLLTPVSENDPAEGLFYLRNLNKYGYNKDTITSIYLATPSVNNDYDILTIDTTGRIIKDELYPRGIRPVILFSGAKLNKVQ